MNKLINFARVTKKYFSAEEAILNKLTSKVFGEELKQIDDERSKQRSARAARTPQQILQDALKEAENSHPHNKGQLWGMIIAEIHNEGQRRTPKECDLLFNLLISRLRPVLEQSIEAQMLESQDEIIEYFDFSFPNSPARKFMQAILPIVIQACQSQDPKSFCKQFFLAGNTRK